MTVPRQKRAFTLIELLVVIAIIALLLSIVMPSLKKAKDHARTVLDRNNLKSLSTALHIYLNLYEDSFFAYNNNFLWMSEIGKLVDNIDEVRYSPHTLSGAPEVIAEYNAAPGSKWGSAKRPWLWGNSPDPTQKYQLGSYGLNGWLYSECSLVPAGQKSYIYGKRTAARNPSRTPVILNSNWVDAWPQRTNALATWQSSGGGLDSYSTGARDSTHGDANNSYMMGRFLLNVAGRPETNVVLLDGQVATISHAELWALSWHRSYQPNFNPTLPPR